MSLSTRGAFPAPDGTANWKLWRTHLTDLRDRVAVAVALYDAGAVADRPVPAAALAGMFWRDGGALSWCTGTAWLSINTGAAGKAPDSELLDGLDSAAFLLAGGKAADADKLDGLDSTVFARKDSATQQTFTGAVSALSVLDSGQRVYSPANPPPPGGAVIVQTIRGTVSSSGTSGGSVTIPAVNMAKTQLRHLGTSGSSSDSGGHLQLVNSTTVSLTTLTSGRTASFELTEWS